MKEEKENEKWRSNLGSTAEKHLGERREIEKRSPFSQRETKKKRVQIIRTWMAWLHTDGRKRTTTLVALLTRRFFSPGFDESVV